MTLDDARTALMAQFGWTADQEQHAEEFAQQSNDVFTGDVLLSFYVNSDGSVNQDALNALAGWNPRPTGGTTVSTPSEPTQEAEIQTNFAQVTDLTEALRRIRQGKWTGADGVDGMIVALQGGKPLDFTPTFP